MMKKRMVKSKECPGKYQFEYHKKDGSISYSKPFDNEGGRKAEGKNLSQDFLQSDTCSNTLKVCNYGGNATKDQLQNNFGIKSEDLTKMTWDKLLHKHTTPDGRECFSITEKGREHLASMEGHKIHAYKSQTKDSYCKHDIALSKEIIYHMNKGDIKEMYSESQIKEMYERKMIELRYENTARYEEMVAKNMSPPDFVYVNEQGEMVAIEVVSAHYTQAQIESKMEFCSFMNIQYTQASC